MKVGGCTLLAATAVCDFSAIRVKSSGLSTASRVFPRRLLTRITAGELSKPSPLVGDESFPLIACNWGREMSLLWRGWKTKNNITPIVKQHNKRSIADMISNVARGALGPATALEPWVKKALGFLDHAPLPARTVLIPITPFSSSTAPTPETLPATALIPPVTKRQRRYFQRCKEPSKGRSPPTFPAR
jgi:hypothetical protein